MEARVALGCLPYRVVIDSGQCSRYRRGQMQDWDKGEATIPEVIIPGSVVKGIERPYRIFHVNDCSDDQVLFQAACRKALVPFDWQVTYSAEKGIAYLESAAKQTTDELNCLPDLVLLDIVMPMVTGFEVLKFIRETPCLETLPVVMLTGSEHPAYQEQARKLGANGFLRKPSDFTDCVRLALDLYGMLRRWRKEDV